MLAPLALALATIAIGNPVPSEPLLLRARVLDARTRQPVPFARVQISAGGRETSAGADGRFAVAGLACGALELRVSASGYRPFAVRMVLRASPPEFEVALEPLPPRLATSLTVTPDAAPPVEEPAATLARSYDAQQLREVSSVAVDDPLRAVQALPGVAANDEFNAGFASRGSGFSAAGLYLDGLRLNAPFHTVQDVNESFTLTLFNSDVLQSVTLLPGSAPARYGDRLGPVVAVRTREGRRDGVHGRATLGAAGAYVTLEGPLGGGGWLVSARKSYLDYVVEHVDDGAHLALGYQDLTARLTLHPRPDQTLALLGLFGRLHYRDTAKDPDPHGLLTAGTATDLALLSWRLGSPDALAFATSAFVLREHADNHDGDGFQRYSSETWSAGVQSELSWRSGPFGVEGGFEARRLHEEVLTRRFDTASGEARVLEDYGRRGWLSGVFAQASFVRAGGGLVATVGGRLDHLDTTGDTVVLPRASLELALGPSTRLLAAAGGYAQFPTFEQLAGEHGNPDLRPERSRQLALALEQRLGERLRARLEAYHQQERDLFFNRELDYRLEAGRVVAPAPDAVLLNSLSGPSRGLELTLAAGGGAVLTGYLGYAFEHAERRDPSGLRFDSDFDQRHTLTAFLRARASSTVCFSSAFRYGSGLPFPGFLRQAADGVFVSEERNRFGPPAYSRWDLRGERRFVWRRATLALFLEVANVAGRENHRYTDIAEVDLPTGRVRLHGDDLLPRLPLFGLSVEF